MSLRLILALLPHMSERARSQLLAGARGGKWESSARARESGNGNLILVKPAVGFTLPWAGGTPAPSTNRKWRGRHLALRFLLGGVSAGCLRICPSLPLSEGSVGARRSRKWESSVEDLRTSGLRNDLLERYDQGWQVVVHDLP